MTSDSTPSDPLHGLDPQKLAEQALRATLKPGQPPEGLVERLAELLPEYEIGECLGRGGMGVVFKATQRKLGRLVAIKVLLPAPDEALAWRERFEREARALASLSHPGIIGVFDYGQAEELCYLVTEYVEGVNLRSLLAEGKLAPKEALAIVPQLCDALQCAHDQGIVHRDIKPENILLDQEGTVKIADFGLAKLTGGDMPLPNLTLSSQAMGTLRYMAPEQLDSPREVDHRADIFSLGVVFYEMLTGEIPAGNFQAPSKKVSIDVRLDEVVLRAMQSEPERRYQHVSEVKTRVEQLGTETRTRSRAKGKSPKPPTGIREKRAAEKGKWRGSRKSDWFPLWTAIATVLILVMPSTIETNPGYSYRGVNSFFLSPLVLPFWIGAGAMLWHDMGRSRKRSALITRLLATDGVLVMYYWWSISNTPHYAVTGFGKLCVTVHVSLLLLLALNTLATLLLGYSNGESKTLLPRLSAPKGLSATDKLRIASIALCAVGACALVLPWGNALHLSEFGFRNPRSTLLFGWNTGHAIATTGLLLFPGVFRAVLMALGLKRTGLECGLAILFSLTATVVTSFWLFYHSGLHFGSLLVIVTGTSVALLGLVELALPGDYGLSRSKRA